MPIFRNFTEGADNIGLVLVINTQIRIIPLAENTKADKVLLLPLNLAQSIVPTLLPERFIVNFNTGLTVLFLNLMFNGQTMTVPTGHIGGVITHHRARLDDNILEDFVDRMANMNNAIGVGRAVVKNKLFAPRSGLANGCVQLILLPFF